MRKVKLHYDGWICLPASLCQVLDLSNGDRLLAELVDGAIALRPVAKRTGRDQHIETTASPVIVSSKENAAPSDAMPARRRPGRPRKNAVAEPASSAPEALVMPEPETAAEPVVRREPWILRKKADLLPAVQVVDKPAPPQRRPEWRSDDGFPFVERRPFRQVEVRKLGPGRGHNRPYMTARQPL